MFNSLDAMMTDANASGEDVSLNVSAFLKTSSAIPPTRKRSLCFGETVSPSLELADNLQDLTTSSRKSWKSRDVNQARRKLSLVFVDVPPRDGMKLSIDDGCFVESPLILSNSSSPASTSSNFNDLSRRGNILFSRFTSEQIQPHGLNRGRSSSVCLFPDEGHKTFQPINSYRRYSDDDKENMTPSTPSSNNKNNNDDKTSLVSCFKSPSITPKMKKVVFQNQTNKHDNDHNKSCRSLGLARCTSYNSSRQRRSFATRRQDSIDDGFVEQLNINNINNILQETPTKQNLDLPRNFERLLFSPLIECHELETNLSNDDDDDDDFNNKYNTDNNNHDNDTNDAVPQRFARSASSPPHHTSSNSSTISSSIFFTSSSSKNNPHQSVEPTFSRIFSESEVNAFGSSMDCFQRRRGVLRSESVDEQQLSSNNNSSHNTHYNKKRRKSNLPELEEVGSPASLHKLTKYHSEAELCIKSALNLDEMHHDLIGDFSRKYSLPLIIGKHQDLKTISIDTMASLLKDGYSGLVDSFVIVDCRYPYEFDGGHIRGAINVHSTSDLMVEFFSKLQDHTVPLMLSPSLSSSTPMDGENDFLLNPGEIHSESSLTSGVNSLKVTRNIVVFHCEFSSERGPKLSRFLRNTDRGKNVNSYPFLHYPELYLLEGGYKAFFEVHPNLCQPDGYVPMLHPNYSTDLRLFRNRSCSLLTSRSLSKFLFSDHHHHRSMN